MKMGSLLETKLFGNPWSLQTKSRNKRATLYAVWCVGRAPKWAPLEKWSTTTIMMVKPWDEGKLVMKSRDKSSQNCEGMGRGWRSPASFFASYLVCIRGQSKFWRIWWRVFGTPVWPPRGEAWNSSKRIAVKGVGKGSQIRPWQGRSLLLMVISEWALGWDSISWSNWTYWGSCNKESLSWSKKVQWGKVNKKHSASDGTRRDNMSTTTLAEPGLYLIV